MDITKVRYSHLVTESDIPVRGHAIDSGDEDFDLKVENEIIGRLDRGDIYAWCSIQVEASIEGFVGYSSQIHGCSYENEDDLIADTYYEDLKVEALKALQAKIEDVRERLNRIG